MNIHRWMKMCPIPLYSEAVRGNIWTAWEVFTTAVATVLALTLRHKLHLDSPSATAGRQRCGLWTNLPPYLTRVIPSDPAPGAGSVRITQDRWFLGSGSFVEPSFDPGSPRIAQDRPDRVGRIVRGIGPWGLPRLFHAPTRTTSSGCFVLHSEAIRDVKQTRGLPGY